MEKYSFVNLYVEHLLYAQHLPPEERIQLWDALILYATTRETPTFTGLLYVCFDLLRGDMDRSYASYEKVCARNQRIGRARKESAAKKAEAESLPAEPDDSIGIQSIPDDSTGFQSIPDDSTGFQSIPDDSNYNTNTNSNTNTNINTNSNTNSNTNAAPDTPPDSPSFLDMILRGDEDVLKSFRAC